mmetsp:Transcript_6792/g.15472  ORF Transcript_6792/g.15472 Transcript_6792/m.15472 type:complete len:208 (+) Transcript_6792:273-896(+)
MHVRHSRKSNRLSKLSVRHLAESQSVCLASEEANLIQRILQLSQPRPLLLRVASLSSRNGSRLAMARLPELFLDQAHSVTGIRLQPLLSRAVQWAELLLLPSLDQSTSWMEVMHLLKPTMVVLPRPQPMHEQMLHKLLVKKQQLLNSSSLKKLPGRRRINRQRLPLQLLPRNWPLRKQSKQKRLKQLPPQPLKQNQLKRLNKTNRHR